MFCLRVNKYNGWKSMIRKDTRQTFWKNAQPINYCHLFLDHFLHDKIHWFSICFCLWSNGDSILFLIEYGLLIMLIEINTNLINCNPHVEKMCDFPEEYYSFSHWILIVQCPPFWTVVNVRNTRAGSNINTITLKLNYNWLRIDSLIAVK